MNSVQIGKTTYSVLSDSTSEHGQRVLELQKGNTRKTLIQGAHTGDWSLWSGIKGLPKLVSPKFC